MPRATDEFGRFKCTRCKQWLQQDDFSRAPRRAGGRNGQCKQCMKDIAKQRNAMGKAVPRHLDAKQFIKNWKKYSLRELSAIYGFTEAYIKTIAGGLRKIGWNVPYRGKSHPTWNRDDFVRLANSMPISDIADKLGLSYSAVVNRIIKCRKEGYNL